MSESVQACIDNGGHFWPDCDDGTKPPTCTRCGFNPGWKAGKPRNEELRPVADDAQVVVQALAALKAVPYEDWDIPDEQQQVKAVIGVVLEALLDYAGPYRFNQVELDATAVERLLAYVESDAR